MFLVGALFGAAACFVLLTNRAQESTTSPTALEQAPVPAKPDPVPNAAEVFRLRGECERLGEKILAGNYIGSALAQEQASHYEPRTAHCYVELDVHTADMSKIADYSMRYLYDGQTNELLAYSGYQKGHKQGIVYHPRGPNDFKEPGDYIDDMMTDKDR